MDIFILFGEMGVGKSHYGKYLAEQLGYTYFEGDLVIPTEMLEKIVNFKPIPKEILDKYIKVLAQAIACQAEYAPDGLVVSQALYFDEDRKFLKFFLNCLGYNVRFYWVKTSFFKNVKQLLSRYRGVKWVAYWLMSKKFFQPPTHPYRIVDNS